MKVAYAWFLGGTTIEDARVDYLRAAVFFLAFFLALFMQFPLNGSLIGNTDAIGTLVIYREHLLKLKELFFGVQYGHTFYPGAGLTSYCEPYWGETFMYAAIRLLGFNDLWNVYLLVSFMYALNGFSVFCLTRFYTKDFGASLFAGLVFSACSYMLCNNEMMNALAFFPTPFALLYLERYLFEEKLKYLFFSLVLLALQFYFSTYNFAFGILLSLVFVLSYSNKILKLFTHHWKGYACFFSLFLLLIAPMYYFIVLSGNFQNAFNPLAQLPGVTERFSLALNNFTASFPNNLIYKGGISDTAKTALRNQYYTNLGFVFWGVALCGVVGAKKFRWRFVLITLAAILVSFGLKLSVGGFTATMPLYWLYKFDAVKTFYRIPGRTFVVAAFGLSILFSFGLVFLKQKLSYYKPVYFLLLAIFIVENIPFPFPIERNGDALIPPKGYVDFYEKQKLKVVAELPSSLFTNRFQYTNGISEFSREYRYMYWQTIHKNNSVNGSGSFFPNFRMHNSDLMANITQGKNLEKLIAFNHLDYITFHKKFVFAEEEKGVGAFLAGSLLLQKQLENDEIIVYSIKPVKN